MKEELNPETAKIQTEVSKDMLNTTMKTMRGMVKSLVISAIKELVLASICKSHAKLTQTKQ